MVRPTLLPPTPGNPAVKRVNFKFLLILMAGLSAAVISLYFLRQFQVSRHAGSKLELARKRLEEGKVADAMSLLSQYVKLRPNDEKAFAEYSKLLLGRATSPDATRNDVARAFNALEAAVRSNPEDDELRLQLAEFQLRVGRATDAREHLVVLAERLEAAPPADAAGQPPTDLDARRRRVGFLQATSYLGSGEFEEAARIAARLVGYDLGQRAFRETDRPAKAETDAFVLLAAILEERYDAAADARGVLEELVKQRGDDPRAWLAMTNWYREQGDKERAQAAIAKAIELAPDDPDCVFAEFELALAGRDLDRARAIAERAVKLFPDEERAYRGLAAVLMERGELAAAESVLLDGVERLPGKASLQLMLTDALLQQNKLIEAGQAIARIRELYGATSGPVGILEARVLVAEGRWTEAKAKLEQVRPVVLGNGELVRQVDLYLGQCHAQLNEYDAQLEVNRRILNEAPDSLAARAGAAQALVSSGKTAEALEELETIAAALPENLLPTIPQVWYPLLQLRIASQADLPAADRDWSGVERLLEILTAAGTVPPAQLALLRAEALVRQDEPQAARDLLEAAAADADDDPQVWASLATLALRSEGPEAATGVLKRVPDAIKDDAALLMIETRIAAGLPAAEARNGLESIEARAGSLAPAAAAKVYSALAPIRLAAGEREAATRLWEKAAAAMPDDLAIREAMLETAILTQNPEAARAATTEIARIVGAGSARSRVAEASVKLLEARQLLAKLTPQDPQESARPRELPDDVGNLLDQARNLLVEAENERAGWGQIQVLFADVEGLRGNQSAAIDRLRRAVTIGTDNPAIVRRLVALLYSENRLEEAQEAMASLGAGGTQGLERISAEVELRAGKFDDAVALAERSVAGDTQNHEDLLWLGQLLIRSGKIERAGEILERATELAPQRPETWFALFSQRLAANAPGQAVTALERGGALLPEPRRQLSQAQGYQILGRGDEAGNLLEETERRWPDDMDVLRNLAAFQIGKGRHAEARRLLERILTADGADAETAKPWARRALAELRAGQGTYRDLLQALELLQANRVIGEPLSSEDISLEISLLSNRPEPASWRRAVDLLDDLAGRQPLTPAERMMRAQLREKLGDWPAARDDLVGLVANPKTPPAYVALLIEKLIAHGETSTANTWIRRLEKTSPDSAITLALQAKLAIAENNREQAVDYAKRLMPGGAVPVDKPAQLAAVARLMEDLGFPKAADRVLERYAGMDIAGIRARVEFLGRQGRAAEALDLLEANWDALSLERGLSLGVQVLRSQVDDAAATVVAGRIAPWIEKGKRLDPGSIIVRLIEAELQTLQGRTPEAEAIYRKLLAEPDLGASEAAIVANNLAFHLAKPATADEAGALIDKAIAELGPLPDLLDTRGLVRLAKGEPEAAVTDLREAILAPSAAKYLHLAAAELAAGDEAAARKSLEAARRERLAMQRLTREDVERLKLLEQKLGSQAVSTAAADG